MTCSSNKHKCKTSIGLLIQELLIIWHKKNILLHYESFANLITVKLASGLNLQVGKWMVKLTNKRGIIWWIVCTSFKFQLDISRKNNSSQYLFTWFSHYECSFQKRTAGEMIGNVKKLNWLFICKLESNIQPAKKKAYQFSLLY